MATDPANANDEGTATAPAAKAAPPAPVQTLTVADWRDRARGTFGISPHALAGALYGKSDDTLLTKIEVQDLIDEFAVRKGT